MIKRFFCLLLAYSSLILPVFSKETVLSLDEAIAAALKSHPDILNSEREIDRARAQTLQLAAFPNPDLIFSNEGIPFRPGRVGREFSLGLRQLVEFPGKRGLRKTIGLKREDISASNLEAVRLQVITRVKKAYWLAAFTEMAIASLEDVLETLGDYQRLAAIRFQTGEVASTDILRGRLEEIRVQNEILEAERSLLEQKADLWLEMGAETPPSYPSLAPLRFTPLTKGLEELKQEAADRPSLRALRQELSLRETSVQLAGKNFLPDLRLGLFYPSLNASGWGFEVEVSIPLRRQALRGGLQEAAALREQGIISLRSASRRIMNRIETLYADVRAASDQVGLIESSLLRDSADLLSMGISNYQYGKVDSLNLFDIYRMHKESRLQYLRALLNYHLFLTELEAAGEDS